MKSFDDWFEEKYTDDLYNADEMTILYESSFIAWQAAQEVQRESDADVFITQYSDGNTTGADIYMSIRNNKAV